jgi:LysR family transcriptional regulator, hypochlorite-specific transcription factor HypT
MDLKTLEDFLTLAEVRNFSRAAQLRHVTQPAFSRRIKALEAWVGVALVDRSAFPTDLTSAGLQFCEIARDVVRRIHQGREEVRASQRRHEATVQFAMPHSLAVTYFPHWWGDVSRGLESGCAKVVAGNYHDCVQRLVHGSCQFMLCFRHRAVPLELDEGEFPGIRVGTDLLVPVVSAGAGPGGRAAARLPGTADRPLPFLGYESDAFFGRVVADVLAASARGAHLNLRY